MKRVDLMKEIAAAAKAAEVEWVFVRQGRAHEVWQFGIKRFTVPRHREISDSTVEAIRKQMEEGT